MAAEIPTELAGAATCRILTRGRVSGATHGVTVWYAPIGRQLYVAVRHGLHSDWLRNALVQERIAVTRRGRSWPATAALVDDSDERGRALDAFAQKYTQHRSIIRTWRADPPTFVRLELDV